MKSVKKSDCSSLVKYLADNQAKQSRIAYTSVINCQSIDLQGAVIEMMAIQGMNTRTEADKTYHLIVSFRPGERPEDSVIKAIESEICKGLGYGEHQRVSVAHDDTDNFHLHMAINKIHPVRLTIHNPYNDYKTLAQLCGALELQFGLEFDNHLAARVESENRAQDMEHHAGVESLLGWIKRECLAQLLLANSWAQIHGVLQTHNLVLVERGNGLVICDQAGLMVKASSVSRALSKTKLVERFGEYKSESNLIKLRESIKHYEARPMRSGMDTTLLYERYKNEQQRISHNRGSEWQVLRAKRERSLTGVKRAGQLKRSSVKLLGSSRTEKKCLYALISRDVKSEFNRINEQYRRERERLVKKYQPLQWADWLRQGATSGDPEALKALRARKVSHERKGNTLSAKSGGKLKWIGGKLIQESVTKKGTIIYHIGTSSVRDDGDSLKVSRGATEEGLKAALLLAIARYGTQITVNGSADFKIQIVTVAAKAKLQLTFIDSGLEQQRKALVKQEKPEENESKTTDKSNKGPISSDKLEKHGFASADLYINEREHKRLTLPDIKKHRRYTEADNGLVTFMGVRNVAGESLALLERNEVILVMPIDQKTVNSLSRLAIGEAVTCTGRGIVKTKGKSR